MTYMVQYYCMSFIGSISVTLQYIYLLQDIFYAFCLWMNMFLVALFYTFTAALFLLSALDAPSYILYFPSWPHSAKLGNISCFTLLWAGTSTVLLFDRPWRSSKGHSSSGLPSSLPSRGSCVLELCMTTSCWSMMQKGTWVWSVHISLANDVMSVEF